MKCPRCETEFDSRFKFCMKCGSKLEPILTGRDPVMNLEFAHLEPPEVLSYTKDEVVEPKPPAPAPVFSSPVYHQVAEYPQKTIKSIHSKRYGVAKLSILNIWGPFSGFGSRKHHESWLMDGQGPKAEELLFKVADKIQVREIPGSSITQATLTARGLLVERRNYFIVKRGLVRLALYIAEFGKDLFISSAGYMKLPISNLRVLVIGLILFFQAYFVLFYTSSVNNAFERVMSQINLFDVGSIDASALINLLCVIGPLGVLNTIFVVILVVYSLYKWLTERDFLAALRVPPNEFNEDDLMAMSKAVEQTVRICLDEIGLDPDELKSTRIIDNRRII